MTISRWCYTFIGTHLPLLTILGVSQPQINFDVSYWYMFVKCIIGTELHKITAKKTHYCPKEKYIEKIKVVSSKYFDFLCM